MTALRTCVLVLAVSLGVSHTLLGAVPPVEWDGLQRTKIKGIDVAYVRPGVDLSRYTRVMLDPVEVAFDKNWKPERTGSRTAMSPEDRERIKSDLSELAADAIKDTLGRKNWHGDGYAVDSAPGPDVMRLSTALVDVYINAPDVQAPGRASTYVVNAGRMTLVAELRDSETGALFARVLDQREARDDVGLTWSSRVENSSAARSAVTQWANILRSRLDAVRVAAAAP
jgi:hypothetical protein